MLVLDAENCCFLKKKISIDVSKNVNTAKIQEECID